MSLLTVENLSHTFGDRTLFKDVSFRLLAEDHVGLVGVNGVGGTIVIVCHEPEFYEGWITKVWNVEEWSEQLTH